jgi:hypothetical protein
MVRVHVEGVSQVQALFRRLEHELSAREMLTIMRPAGRVVVKASRPFVPLTGRLGNMTKRDIGITKSKVVKGRAEVDVGLRFKFYDLNDQVQKIAPIVRHFTEGFHQTSRASDGRNRGRVRNRTEDFMERGFNASQAEQMAAINDGVRKKIAKL